MTNKQTPAAGKRLAMVCLLTFSSLCHAASSLGEINIELRGNVVDFTCAVIASDSNKSVELGTADQAASDQRRYYSTGRVYAEARRLPAGFRFDNVFRNSGPGHDVAGA